MKGLCRPEPTLRRAAWAALMCAILGVACSTDGARTNGLAAKGPTVGQSGSEGVPPSGGSTAGCPCGMKDALRVTVMAKHGAKVSLRVEETLHGSSAFASGEVIEGTRYDDTFACFAGCADVAVSEQAFAFFMAPLQLPESLCPEREACLATCQGENPDELALPNSSECACRPVPVDNAPGSPTCGTPFGNPDCQGQCSYETRGRCPPPPEPDPKRLHVALSPWRDPIVFARGERGELSVPLSRLEELFQLSGADQAACIDRFGQWSDFVESTGF